MKPKRIHTDYLRDIIEYADKATRFVQGLDLETFQKDEQKTLAVVRALEVIGEAARHIPRTLRDKYPDIPWKRVVGMRDKVIHDYFGVDLEVVWKTLQDDLPPLVDRVKQMLSDLESAK